MSQSGRSAAFAGLNVMELTDFSVLLGCPTCSARCGLRETFSAAQAFPNAWPRLIWRRQERFITATPVIKADRNGAWGCWSSQTLRSRWLSKHDLTACRDHLADRAPANNEEHRDACRHQGQLEGQRRHRPMNVNDLSEDCEASKNSDMILKRSLAFAACEQAQVEAIYNRFDDANSNDAPDAKQ